MIIAILILSGVLFISDIVDYVEDGSSNMIISLSLFILCLIELIRLYK